MTRLSVLRFGKVACASAVLLGCALVGLAGSPPGASAALLKIGLLEEPKSLNLFAASKDIWASKVLLFCYQRLYYRDPDGENLVPWLAQDEPVWDETAKTVTFHVREAKWDDGSPFTAYDVVFTADMIRRFRIPAYWNNWNFVDKVEAPDARTVVLTLARPSAILWERTLTSVVIQKARWASLAGQAQKLLEDGLKAQEAAGKSGQEGLAAALVKPVELLTTHPVNKPESVGPFSFHEWQKGAYIHLKRNERFFGRNATLANRTLGPHVEGIVFKVFGNTDTAILALKKGEIDYFWWGIESGYLEDLRKSANIRVFSEPKSGFRYLGFNLRRPPMAHPAFRHAVAYLVDKDFIVQRILHNEGVRLDTLVPPEIGKFTLKNPPRWGEGLTWKERVSKAVALLKEAGYRWDVEPEGGQMPGQFSTPGGGLKLPDGQPIAPINLLSPPADYDAQRAQTANLVQQWLKEFGVPVNWKPMAFSAMNKKIGAERDFDMFVSGWGALGQDPDFLRSFFHSREDKPEGKNTVGYRNPQFDELADRQALAMDVAERQKMVHRLQEMLNQDLPYLPLYVPMNLEGVRTDKFEGWEEMSGGIGNLWTFLQVKPVKK